MRDEERIEVEKEEREEERMRRVNGVRGGGCVEKVMRQMRVEIVRERDNKLLRRKELLLRIIFDDVTGSGAESGESGANVGGANVESEQAESASVTRRGTPSRKEVRDLLVKMFRCSPNVLVVDWMKQTFGKCEVLGYVKIYESEQRMREIERKHILRRNFGEEEGAAASAAS